MTLLNTMKNAEVFSRVMQDLVHEKGRDNGLNKSEIAEELGISPQTLSGYLAGKHIPEYHRLSKIAEFFNTSISRLLGEDVKVAADTKTKQKPESDLDQLPLTKLERDIIRMSRANENDTALQNFLYKLIEGAANAGNGQSGGAD